MLRSAHPAGLLPALAVATLWLLATAASLPAQALRIEGPADGLLERGAPAFAVRSPEALGLTQPPTDLRLLPDGRILVFAAQQIVLGDGVRWKLFRAAPNEDPVTGSNIAIDNDGSLYVGVRGGFARIEFQEDGTWRPVFAQSLMPENTAAPPVARRVFESGPDWFWHSGSGAVRQWRPGQEVRPVGRGDTLEHVFSFRDHHYIADRTAGSLARFNNNGTEPLEQLVESVPSQTITCTVPFDDHRLLAGTYGNGLKFFDGQQLLPFREHGLLAGNVRVNSLCQTEGGYFAAAIENIGIVFFDREGFTVQVLDRSFDHRLAHVRRLVPAPGGLIWGLLSDGVLQVEFPSRVSHFEQLIGTGGATATPLRHEGKLWVIADGSVLRGDYDDDHRLKSFVHDSPPGRFAFTLSCAMGMPVAGTEKGAYIRTDTGWIQTLPETTYLRLLNVNPTGDRWLYGAVDEVGWLWRDGDGFSAERHLLPELGNVYNSVADPDDGVWLELGSSRVAHLRVENNRPIVDIFDQRNDLPEGWVQCFEFDGIIRFNVGGQIMRFNRAARRFERDTAFHERFPDLRDIIGRPARDAWGRIWIAANGRVQVLDDSDGTLRNLNEKMPAGLMPFFFTFEDNGVVWMHADRRFARYDPSLSTPKPEPLRALITHVELPASARTLFPTADPISLSFSDNSLVAHFVTPHQSFGASVTFDVQLEGTGAGWVSLGTAGSAAFNRLAAGDYTLHVRPSIGSLVGEASSLSFSILPPWYRTTYAYVAYALSAIGLVLLAGRVSSYLQRRENLRLERLVAQRTRELNATTERLASQVEEIEILSQAIAQSPVAVFITKPDGTIVFANPRACELTGYTLDELKGRNALSLRAESTPPAIIEELAATVRTGDSWRGELSNRTKSGQIVHVRSMVAPIRSADAQVRHHLILEEDITGWLAEQERRRRLESRLLQSQKLESIGTLAGGIAHDFNNILTAILGYNELARLSTRDNPDLRRNLDQVHSAGLRAKDLVSQILTFSRRGNTRLSPLDLAVPVREALKLVRATTPATIEIVADVQSGIVLADSTQIQQIVLNLCTNAIHAMRHRPGRLDVGLTPVTVSKNLAAEIPHLRSGPTVRLAVTDQGEGMEPSMLDRVFDPFFTTKPQGEGTGLGLSIVQGIVTGHNAAMRVSSVPGEGTCFEIYFPVTEENAPVAPVTSITPRGERQHILVVDDEPSVAAFIGSRLEHLGFIPTVMHDPRAVLNAIVDQPDRFHALVTDLTMPHITGADLLLQLRSLGIRLPAVIITGYGRDAVRAKLEAIPACVVLPKPFDGDDLARALAHVLKMSIQSPSRP